MNVGKIAALLVFAVCLSGCSNVTIIKTVPQNLVGVWSTDAPKYADRYFELKKDAVTFALGNGKLSTNTILQVTEAPDKARSFYEISYQTPEGTTQKFAFYYTPPTSTIQIKSQEKMNWTKGQAGVVQTKAAAKPPAGMAELNAQKLAGPSGKSASSAADGTSDLPETVPEGGPKGSRRDPFASLVVKPTAPSAQPIVLPPGKRGILISQANLEGVAKTAEGMIAVVSVPRGGTYFLHPNDAVYNGRVARITADSIVFEETVSDSLGKQISREVVKKLRGEN